MTTDSGWALDNEAVRVIGARLRIRRWFETGSKEVVAAGCAEESARDPKRVALYGRTRSTPLRSAQYDNEEWTAGVYASLSFRLKRSGMEKPGIAHTTLCCALVRREQGASCRSPFLRPDLPCHGRFVLLEWIVTRVGLLPQPLT